MRQLAIFERDGWLCCWCRRPVIFAPAFRLLEIEAKRVASGPVSYYHAHWTRRDSPLLDELGAVIDHAVAHSIGGENCEENLCTSCNKCNGRKNAALLEAWDQRSKRTPIKGVYGEPRHWDGLTMIFVALARQFPDRLTAGERTWLRVLTDYANF